MGKYRKKRIVIEADQYLERIHEPEGLCWNPKCGSTCPHVHTPEGAVAVYHGDWIITGIKGEKYPCRPDIFEETYEMVPCEKTQEKE